MAHEPREKPAGGAIADHRSGGERQERQADADGAAAAAGIQVRAALGRGDRRHHFPLGFLRYPSPIGHTLDEVLLHGDAFRIGPSADSTLTTGRSLPACNAGGASAPREADLLECGAAQQAIWV